LLLPIHLANKKLGVFGLTPLGYDECNRYLLLPIQGEQVTKGPTTRLSIYTNLLTDPSLDVGSIQEKEKSVKAKQEETAPEKITRLIQMIKKDQKLFDPLYSDIKEDCGINGMAV
jgi:hypothetical protein